MDHIKKIFLIHPKMSLGAKKNIRQVTYGYPQDLAYKVQ